MPAVPYLLGLVKMGQAATAQGEERTPGKAAGGSVAQPALAPIRSVQAPSLRAFWEGLAKEIFSAVQAQGRAKGGQLPPAGA